MALRRGRGLVALVVVVVLVVGALVAVDSVMRHRQEQAAGVQLQTRLRMSDPAQVRIGGYPFLVDASRRRLRHVRVDAEDAHVVVKDKDVLLRRLAVDADPVTISGDQLLARQLTGSATADWQQLATLGGYDAVAFVDPTHISVTDTVELRVAGQSVSMQATVRLQPSLDVATQSLTFRSPEVVLSGVTLPPAVSSSVTGRFVQPISLKQSSGLTVTGLSWDAAGVTANVQGSDVDLNSLR